MLLINQIDFKHGLFVSVYLTQNYSVHTLIQYFISINDKNQARHPRVEASNVNPFGCFEYF